MDKEYMILVMLSLASNISQRDISSQLGISLGSVNVLIKKMTRDGLIKIVKSPSNKLSYILTTKGVREKGLKTYDYIKFHYNIMNNLKRNIESIIEKQDIEDNNVYLVTDKEELIKEMKIVFAEIGIDMIVFNHADISYLDCNCPIIVDRECDDIKLRYFKNIIYLDQIL